MKKLFITLLTIIICDYFFSSCANPGAPTGGDKDTIPPKLVTSNPIDQTLRYSGKTITLTFDERVSSEKLQQNLIITPTTENKFKSIAKKNILEIKFEEEFDDSTTYTLNFFDGVTDITERNPAENLILAFSTGNFIDSIRIVGKVTDLFSGEPVEKMIIGLYRLTDSLDFSKDKPTYFSSSNDYGQFSIQNIKAFNYLLLAFKDENRNLLFDAANELYAFKADTLDLSVSPSDSMYLQSIKINAAPQKLISSRPTGLYFEIRYVKQLTDYVLNYDTTRTRLYSQLTGEKYETIRIYRPEGFTDTDSLQTIITSKDSLKNISIDTVFVKFIESTRKKADYTASLIPSKNAFISPETIYLLKFNKPTIIIDSNFAYVGIDTLAELLIRPVNLKTNYNHTELSFRLQDLNRAMINDTLSKLLSYYKPDTTNLDTAKMLIHRQLTRFNPSKPKITIKSNSLVSVEKDTLTSLSSDFRYATAEDFGIVTVEVSTVLPSYTIQLMSKENVARQITNCSTCTFKDLSPGDYWIRVLVDENEDGTWTYGNLLKKIEPEKVLFFKEETSLRANWEVEISISF